MPVMAEGSTSTRGAAFFLCAVAADGAAIFTSRADTDAEGKSSRATTRDDWEPSSRGTARVATRGAGFFAGGGGAAGAGAGGMSSSDTTALVAALGALVLPADGGATPTRVASDGVAMLSSRIGAAADVMIAGPFAATAGAGGAGGAGAWGAVAGLLPCLLGRGATPDPDDTPPLMLAARPRPDTTVLGLPTSSGM